MLSPLLLQAQLCSVSKGQKDTEAYTSPVAGRLPVILLKTYGLALYVGRVLSGLYR